MPGHDGDVDAGDGGGLGAPDDGDPASIEAICRLKYAYFRLLDTKQFEALGLLLTDDVTTSFESGKHSAVGRRAVVEFLESSLGDRSIVTVHNGHHPEIRVHGDGTASGTWYLADRVIAPAFDFELEGTALYSDTYVLTESGWRIRHTGYERIFEERRKRSTGELLSFTSRFEHP